MTGETKALLICILIINGWTFGHLALIAWGAHRNRKRDKREWAALIRAVREED